jgi:hypothetical protein
MYSWGQGYLRFLGQPKKYQMVSQSLVSFSFPSSLFISQEINHLRFRSWESESTLIPFLISQYALVEKDKG